MKLTDEQKTVEVYQRLRAINDLCFTDVDNPPVAELLLRFETGDVFVYSYYTYLEGHIMSYAIVDVASPHAYIWQIATDPENQHRHCATDLLGEIVDYYKDRSIELAVKVDNMPAQVLYLKNGFRVVRVLKEYFGAEQDGLLMRRMNDQS